MPSAPARPRPRRPKPPERRRARPARARPRLLLGLGRDQLAGQAGRLGLQSRDHVDVGGRVQRGHHTPAPLAQHTGQATRPLHQSLDTTQRVGQILLTTRRQFSRRRGRLGVEQVQRLVQLALLVAADPEVLRRRRPPGAQVGLLGAGQEPPHRQQLRRHAVVRSGRRRLPFQGPDLAPHLTHQVAQALQVLGRPRQAAFGPLPATPVLQHARRLLDDRPAVLGPGVQHGVQLPLADDHVLLASHARVVQELLDVHQPARRPVDGVLAVARAEQSPGDGDLGQVDRQLARRIVDGERHLGPAQLGPRRRPGEDDVLHLRRAQRPGTLGPQHPRDRVDHVGLAAPVGADHHGDPGLELQHRRVGKGFETLHAERLQEHRGDPTGGLRGGEWLTPGSARRRRSSGRPPSPARWCCGSAGTARPRGRRPGASPGSRRAHRRDPGTARRPGRSPGA